MNRSKLSYPLRPFYLLIIYSVLIPTFTIGFLIYCIGKIVMVIAHLLMLNFHTAKEEITGWQIVTSIKDF